MSPIRGGATVADDDAHVNLLRVARRAINEGISDEAASLPGTSGLPGAVVYDNNHVRMPSCYGHVSGVTAGPRHTPARRRHSARYGLCRVNSQPKPVR